MKSIMVILESEKARILAALTAEGAYVALAAGLLVFVGFALIVRRRGR